ncbi:MAG: hypothetical protein QOJ17_3195 [Rhodospirillaceae bacterium]|jgi:hypothetical protein|nr:hypothetical protein [Rhodospirillaceae bacterium]
MRFFFYGTLLDSDVAALVLGRRLPPAAFMPASLLGHARRRAKNATYPIVVRDARGEVPGAIVGGLSARDVARLAAYEGPGYRIVPLRVKAAGVMTVVSVFEPVQNRLQPSGELWDLALWQRRHKRAFVGRVRRAVSAHPAYSRQ